VFTFTRDIEVETKDSYNRDLGRHPSSPGFGMSALRWSETRS
jgi:hypothetical protein